MRYSVLIAALSALAAAQQSSNAVPTAVSHDPVSGGQRANRSTLMLSQQPIGKLSD